MLRFDVCYITNAPPMIEQNSGIALKKTDGGNHFHEFEWCDTKATVDTLCASS